MAQNTSFKQILIDTGIIIALADKSDLWHQRSLRFLDTYNGKLIAPTTIIPEACYILNAYLGPSAEMAFIESLVRRQIFLEPVTREYLSRSQEILRAYSDLNVGLVDASVIALAERLHISKILTADRRHFSAIKPKHGLQLELLP
jgi:predicted nucleic acid-binding protein